MYETERSACRFGFQKGGERLAAFEIVYEEYARQVYRFLLSLTRDEQKADELTQKIFYRAFLHNGAMEKWNDCLHRRSVI